MYRKTLLVRRLELKRKRCAAMRGAKERRRRESLAAAEVGRVTFEGKAFGGRHVVRLLGAEWFDARRCMIECDGVACEARTPEGLVRVVARRVFGRAKDGWRGEEGML